MAETPKIYATINAIMSELGAIEKSKRNAQQGFNYRGVDDVMNALNPLMVKHKLFCVPEVVSREREERQTAKGNNLIYSIVTMKFTFCAEDGSAVSAVTVGEGMDSGDKATNKAMAIAYKYACFQTFCIPTEETAPEADEETPEPSRPKWICEQCGKTITGISSTNKETGEAWRRTAQQIAEYTQKEKGKTLCWNCLSAMGKREAHE